MRLGASRGRGRTQEEAECQAHTPPKPLLWHGLSQNQTTEPGVGKICLKASSAETQWRQESDTVSTFCHPIPGSIMFHHLIPKDLVGYFGVKAWRRYQRLRDLMGSSCQTGGPWWSCIPRSPSWVAYSKSESVLKSVGEDERFRNSLPLLSGDGWNQAAPILLGM